jgi:UDP:flavonoid glycosyltransferase YjiC (YdhE family)
MRVLISTRRGAGHFGPLIPFARSLLRDNHQVLVAAPRSAAAMVAAAGMDHYEIPDPPDTEERTARVNDAFGLPADDANRRMVGDVFIRIDSRAAYPHVLAAIESFRPELVLFEESETGALLAAEKAGVPAVSVGITMRSIGWPLRATIAEALDDLRADVGLEPDPDLARLDAMPLFTLTPEALEDPAAPGPPGVLRFRDAPPAAAPRPLPRWWKDDADPLVYLTLGSVAPQMHFFPDAYREAIDALAALPVRVLVTIGNDRDPAELGAVPANVHVARWVPQADVMPHAAAMACHGGHGTVSAGLTAGVPMAVLPLFADQPFNAKRVHELGAGIAVETASQLGDAVRSLLEDPSYRQASRRVADEVRQLPTVDTATAVMRQVAA